MVRFSTTILQFDQQGEKTAWTYIAIPEKIAQELKPGNKKSFRVKGMLDAYSIHAVALLPMGGGNFVMPFNAAMRKGTGKRRGAKLQVQLAADDKPRVLNAALMDCLADEPGGLVFFGSLPPSHQHYFSKWIEQAKTEATRTRRIAMAVSALARQMDFSAMLQAQKKDGPDL